MEAEEPLLYLRREKLALQYAIRLAANPSNPTFKITFPPHILQGIIEIYDNKPNAIRSFGLGIAPLLTSANINKEQIETHFVSEIPSWCIRKLTIDLSLHSEKNLTQTLIYSNRIFTNCSHIIQIMNIFLKIDLKMKKK